MQALARVAVLVSALAPAAAPAAVHQVPGTFSTVGAALAVAASGDTVQVAAGTYGPSTNGESFPLIVSVANVHLLGAGMGASVLDAEGSAGVIEYSTAVGGGRISGFTITGGAAVNGAGIWVKNGDPEIDHNLVTANTASGRGAGMRAHNASTPWMHHNVVWQNSDADTTDLMDPHGVIFEGTATGIFENNLVGRMDGNGLLTAGTALPSVRHNIFFENGDPAPQPRGRGICWLASTAPDLFHNLFHGNYLAALLWPTSGGDFSGTAANDLDSLDAIYGNLDGDPLLVDADGGDFTLQPASPAIDAGEPTFPPDPDGTTIDIGPFYYHQNVNAAPLPEGDTVGLRGVPNPFTGGTDLVFSLARRTPVRIDVYDTAGRRVRSLHDEALSAGPQAVRWDGRTDRGRPAAAGVYLVRVRTAEGSWTAPVIRLR
jgi:hypothetical protein